MHLVYGYPGDGVGGLGVALEKALKGKYGNETGMEYIQIRHQEMAAFMASAHAKFTGGVGFCYASSGPRAIHLLNGLHDAKMDNMPVVAIVGQQGRTALGAHYQQKVDLLTLFKDVASDYVAIAILPEHIRHLVDRAVRIAQNKRSVTCIIIPNDLQLLTFKDPSLVQGNTHTGVGYPVESKVPEMDGLQAARTLNEGKKVAMLVGVGCLDATNEVIAVAKQARRRHRQSAAGQVLQLGRQRQGTDRPRAGADEHQPRPGRGQGHPKADKRHEPPRRHGAHGFRCGTSVVNRDCRSWNIPNLWICDGSVFPTVSGVNPSLTITAIAMRTAARIGAMAKRGELSARASWLVEA